MITNIEMTSDQPKGLYAKRKPSERAALPGTSELQGFGTESHAESGEQLHETVTAQAQMDPVETRQAVLCLIAGHIRAPVLGCLNGSRSRSETRRAPGGYWGVGG